MVSELVPWTLPKYVIAILTAEPMIGFAKSYFVAVDDQQSYESRSDTLQFQHRSRATVVRVGTFVNHMRSINYPFRI